MSRRKISTLEKALTRLHYAGEAVDEFFDPIFGWLARILFAALMLFIFVGVPSILYYQSQETPHGSQACPQ